jgi:predicted neutral ceramidase superfamily lipid hydrolase
MSPLILALVCGVAFGALAVLLMLPMPFADKPAALVAAFANRFAIGFLIPLVSLPMPSIAKGLLIGLLISIPDAIITKAYVPILVMGALGGLVIGWVAGRWA